MLIKKVSALDLPRLDFVAKVRRGILILMMQAVSVRKHLDRNRKDKDAKFRLILIESRIHRLSRYYKAVGVLPPVWK